MTPSPRRAVVEVRFGPLSSRKLVIGPGQTVKIGRAEPADLVVARDAEMSGAHLELSWDGEHCRVRDLDSAKGTFVQGTRIEEVAEVENGAWIVAGTTNLMVYFEILSSASGSPSSVNRPTAAEVRAVDALRAESLPLFAVVDAAHGIEPLTLLRGSVDPHQSLYDGVQGEALALVAPYLVALRRDSQLLERLVHDGWSKRWAIFFTCARPFVEVRRHLRRFLVVEQEGSAKKYFLRFFDPSVLPALLGSSTPRQRQQLFGEIGCFFAQGPDGELVRLTPEHEPGAEERV